MYFGDVEDNEGVAAAAFVPVKTGSVRSRVQETLREAIFSGKLQPGDQIREAHLARALHVSQPSVREALLQLEHAGLVTRQPNKETTVTRLTSQDVRERAELRVLLEAKAAIQAAERMEDPDFRGINERAAAVRDALNRDSYQEYTAADLSLHRFIWELSGNRTLYQILDLLTVPLFAFLSIRRGRRLKNLVHVVQSHDPIVAAMFERNPDAISEAIRQHIEGSYSHPDDSWFEIGAPPRP